MRVFSTSGETMQTCFVVNDPYGVAEGEHEIPEWLWDAYNKAGDVFRSLENAILQAKPTDEVEQEIVDRMRNTDEIRLVVTTEAGNSYRISNLGAGSAKYGPCEVCDQPASLLYLQTDQQTGKQTFGHHPCLVGLRK